MHRLWEILLGLPRDFLDKEGEFALRFQPSWPMQQTLGAGTWNLFLGLAIILLVVYVYRRDGHSRKVRLILGSIRMVLLFFILAMLNHPILLLTESVREPSVLAVVVDNTMSMTVRDAIMSAGADPVRRLDAIKSLLNGDDASLIKKLSTQHIIHFYRFDTTAQPLYTLAQLDPDKPASPPDYAAANKTVDQLDGSGDATQVLASVQSVLDDLRGQRVAGVVLLTDGRSTHTENLKDGINNIKSYGVPIYPIAIGSETPPRDTIVDKISVQDSAFQGDVVMVKAYIEAHGYPVGHTVHVRLLDKQTGAPLLGPTSQPVELDVQANGNTPVEVELPFKADQLGQDHVEVQATKDAGELDENGANTKSAVISVLDAKINVLYVDGYPRWEYRYIKNEMIRQKTVRISCWLASADVGFHQEASENDPDQPSWRITEFPRNMEELMRWDVVIFGDVDPRQFSADQLQLISDFVADKHGGFGMVAGPRYSPQEYRNTPIEALLPVDIKKVEPMEAGGGSITQGFRPVLTPEGEATSIFRFYAEKTVNDAYLKNDWQPIFWYCRGIVAKPGVAQVLAEHPTETGPDGHKAPLLVVGYFGGGRTLFSAIDDSWRWRFYTGESVFDTYWVQQLRYLARTRKLGQRRLTFVSDRNSYEVGEQIHLDAEMVDPQLATQLPDQLNVELVDSKGRTVRQVALVKQEGGGKHYMGTVTASMDLLGELTAKLPSVASGVDDQNAAITVTVPRLELADPQIDRQLLSQLGQLVDLADARAKLPMVIKSAELRKPLEHPEALWDAPLAMLLFVGLITSEWITRKMYGML